MLMTEAQEPLNTRLIAEYRQLCTQLDKVAGDVAREDQLFDRLDRIWYAEMTAADRIEAERQLAQEAASHAEQAAHHTDTGWR